MNLDTFRRRRGSLSPHITFTMKVGDKRTFGGLVFLLAGVAAQMVNHPLHVCAVKGSSLTLPCYFKPASRKVVDGPEVPHQIIRVIWCKNHRNCYGRFNAFDSKSKTNDPRFLYLGDKRTNCTLQITDVRYDDDATFRFRMEASQSSGYFINQIGVRVSVVDETELRINSSSDDGMRSEGQDIQLLCTSRCSTHQLNITWFRDGHTLSETGHALQLSALTAGDSGKYTCGSKTSRSPPYSLHVVVTPGSDHRALTAVHLLLLAVHTVLIIIVVVTVVTRSRDCRKAAAAQQQTA